jgi:hypothetical protein
LGYILLIYLNTWSITAVEIELKLLQIPRVVCLVSVQVRMVREVLFGDDFQEKNTDICQVCQGKL